MNTTKYEVGIVGYGDFTRLMLEYLSPFADILVSSRQHDSGDAGFGAKFASNAEVLARPIIILSIPAQFITDYLKQNKDFINPDALVMDVCSVKTKPVEAMIANLPETCSIIGTHPMFGPASVAKNGGLDGLKCVVSDVRVSDEQLAVVRSFVGETLKLVVIDKTPDKHDQEMAYVQGLSHYIGRVMDIMDIPESQLSTLAYDDLLDMKKIQGSDSWDLFQSIMEQNPYAAAVNTKFKKALQQLDERLS